MTENNQNKTDCDLTDGVADQKKKRAREGGLEKPFREPIPWEDPVFYDEIAFEKELRRVADICHSCRRCFNLCKSFPHLFDAIDESTTGEVDALKREDFQPAIDACTLCDMCFMVKCPYVPPHPFNIDFPHLMLRARAIAAKKKGMSWAQNQLTKTDRNGKLGCACAGLSNWAVKKENKLTRPMLEKAVGIHHKAHLPSFEKTAFHTVAKKPAVNKEAPGFGEKVILYTTCFGTYHDHRIAQAALNVLAHNGVDVKIVYAGCCGMPRFEQGCVQEVAQNALKLTKSLLPLLESAEKILSIVPSCTLMMAHEWPLLHPHDANVKKVASAIMDVTAYLVDLHERKGLTKGLDARPDGVFLHIPCHSRAQNQGKKAETLMRMLPNTPVYVAERCSGHGGSWGVFKENFGKALQVGKPVMRQITQQNKGTVASECPLAMAHLKQGVEELHAGNKNGAAEQTLQFEHPLETLQQAWKLGQP